MDSNSFTDGRHHMTNLINLFGSANLFRISASEKHILTDLVNDIILFKNTIKHLESYWVLMSSLPVILVVYVYCYLNTIN